MRISPVLVVARTGAMILFALGIAAEAAEVRLISAAPMRPVIQELGPQFERDSGHMLVTKFVPGTLVKRQIDAGETFDIAISLPPLIDDLIKEGKIISGTRADVAYTGVGVGIRRGAPKPEISSVDAFKRTLLDAKSVAHSMEGASGIHFKSLLDRLGITEAMKLKLRPLSGDALARAVPSGEAEMLVQPISLIIASGAELVGPIPSELQSYIRFTAGVGASAKNAEAASALIKFLTAPAAIAVIRARGMEPGAPR